MPHEYTVQVGSGDPKTISTEKHHSTSSIEQWLEDHKGLLGLASTALLTGVSIWAGRGKTGTKIK